MITARWRKRSSSPVSLIHSLACCDSYRSR